MRSTIIGSWFSLDKACKLMLSKAAVSAETPRNALALSTTIVWEKPKRSQIFIRAQTKATAVCSGVASQIAKDVMP